MLKNKTILIGKSCALIYAYAFLLTFCMGSAPIGENGLKQVNTVVITMVADPSLSGKQPVVVRDGLNVNSPLLICFYSAIRPPAYW